MIHFAATVLQQPLDPWQQWLVIHAGEMLPDGRPRFRQVLVIVARQNGKTHLCKVLALFWMFVERWPLIFGTSTNLEQAKEAWEAAVELAETTVLAELVASKRIGNGQQVLTSRHRSRYKIGAADRKGGRGKSIDRGIGDELREQHTWDAYNAAYNAMNARPRAQVVYITNMGDARSVVLNSLRKDALAAAEELEAYLGDPNLTSSFLPAGLERPVALFEWSAPPGSHPTDVHAHAAANPQYGRRMDPDVITSAARRVSKPGADLSELNGFLTEVLCMAVDQLDPAIDGTHWKAGGQNPEPIDTSDRSRIMACFDVSLDLQHATLAVAAPAGDGRYRVEVVAAWDGPDAYARLQVELPDWIRRVRPRALGWFPAGPAAAVDALLRDRTPTKGPRRPWPPRGVTVAAIGAETPAVCMGFAAEVTADRVLHNNDPLLNAQVDTAEKLWKQGRWVFTRRGTGHADAVYAVAGADHLARTLGVTGVRSVRRAHFTS